MQLTAVLTPAEEDGNVAFNPETGTTTQGESVAEAVENLSEATELFLEEFPRDETWCYWLRDSKSPGDQNRQACRSTSPGRNLRRRIHRRSLSRLKFIVYHEIYSRLPASPSHPHHRRLRLTAA